MKVCQLKSIISVLLVLTCSKGTTASRTSDDDFFNVLLGGRFSSVSPSIVETMVPTSTPSKSPTRAPTVGRSRFIETESPSFFPSRDATTANPTADPTTNPTTKVHNITTERPSNHPTEVRNTPTPTEYFRKTDHPTASTISSSPTSSRFECNANNGSFGIVTSDRRIVQYYYKLEYIPGADIAGILSDIERSISSIILNETRLFPQCNSSTSVEGNVQQEKKIVGMSSVPADRVLSYCENSCAIVEGRMTMYISPSQSRRKLSLADDGVNEILFTLKNSMSDGDLNSANSDIVRLTYLEPDDMSIFIDDLGSEKENKEKSDLPVQRSIPAYGYALLATSATLVVVASAIAIRSRSQKFIEEEEDEEENDDDEDPISLEDDGSTGCLDASAATSDRIFMIWKNMNR